MASILLGEVLDEIGRGQRVEVMLPFEPGARLVGRVAPQLPDQRADFTTELQRASGAIALPERHLAGLTGRRRDGHAIVRDVLDAPRGGAEQERLADAALEHHLLVEFADARRARWRAGQEHAVETAIGNRARVRDGHSLGAFARRDAMRDAIPGETRPELGEFVGRVSPRQHVEHAIEDRARERRERRGLAHPREQVVHRPVVHRDHRDDLLRQHVERIARHVRGLDASFAHRPHRRRTGEQVAAVLREDQAGTGGLHLVSGAADPLQPARHRRRGLDLHHEIDGAHVDAEFQRGRAGQAAQASGLERVLDLDALLARQRAVMRTHERLVRRAR